MSDTAESWVDWTCGLGCPPIRLSVPTTLVSDTTDDGQPVLRVMVDQLAVRRAVIAHYSGTHPGDGPT